LKITDFTVLWDSCSNYYVWDASSEKCKWNIRQQQILHYTSKHILI